MTTRYAQYAVVNFRTATVVWHDRYTSALAIQRTVGGIVLNTATAPQHLIEALLAEARKKM